MRIDAHDVNMKYMERNIRYFRLISYKYWTFSLLWMIVSRDDRPNLVQKHTLNENLKRRWRKFYSTAIFPPGGYTDILHGWNSKPGHIFLIGKIQPRGGSRQRVLQGLHLPFIDNMYLKNKTGHFCQFGVFTITPFGME